jgi:hypothetical protein
VLAESHLAGANDIKAPHPILSLPPPLSLYVMSILLRARAQMLQRMPMQRPPSSSSIPGTDHHLSALKGYVTACSAESLCQSSSE